MGVWGNTSDGGAVGAQEKVIYERERWRGGGG